MGLAETQLQLLAPALIMLAWAISSDRLSRRWGYLIEIEIAIGIEIGFHHAATRRGFFL